MADENTDKEDVSDFDYQKRFKSPQYGGKTPDARVRSATGRNGFIVVMEIKPSCLEGAVRLLYYQQMDKDIFEKAIKKVLGGPYHEVKKIIPHENVIRVDILYRSNNSLQLVNDPNEREKIRDELKRKVFHDTEIEVIIRNKKEVDTKLKQFR